jgi:uncharacterized protein
VADGTHADFGKTELTFSRAVPHGYDDELGYVVMVRIAEGDEAFVHTGDVLGPPLKEQLGFLLDANATVLYVDGPMTHMPENYPAEHAKKSLANLRRIIESTNVRSLLVDHHLLRDKDWATVIGPLRNAAEEHDVTLQTAAEYSGQAVDALESRRYALYGLSESSSDRDESSPETREHKG